LISSEVNQPKKLTFFEDEFKEILEGNLNSFMTNFTAAGLG
jgi:hypothetical protein